MHDYKVIGVQPQDLNFVWHHVAPMLQKACDYADGELDVPTLRYWCETTQGQLWLVVEGRLIVCAVVSKIINMKVHKRLHLCSIAGIRMGAWLGILESELLAFGKYHGCSVMTQTGRLGWTKLLGKRGWKQHRVTMAKDIDYG